MSVKNWSFSSKGGRKQKIKQHILDTISLWGAIGLLWFSFVSIIGEHFPNFLQAQVLVAKPQIDPNYVGQENIQRFDMLGMDWWWISFLVVILFVGFEWPSKYVKKWSTACRFAGVAIPIVYIIINLTKIADGIIYMVNTYLPFLNNYYNTRFGLMETGEWEYAPVALTAICMVFWTLIWLIAYGWKKRVLLVLFPIIALGIELAVGLSSHGAGLLYAFFAAILLMLLGECIVWKKAVVLALIWVIVIFSRYGFQEDIEKLSTLESKQWLLRAQNNWNLKQFNPFHLFHIDLHADTENLNNNAPEYTGEIILEIETDEMPNDTIYLKGFYATKYENGNWIYDDTAFKQMCKEAGRKPEEVAELIFQMPYERGYALESQHDTVRNITYKINYTGTTGNVAYAPYLSDYSTADEAYDFLGDYLLKKGIGDTSIEIAGLNMSHGIDRWRTINACIQKAYGGYTSLDTSGYWYSAIDLRDQEKELDFLNSFSQNYLELPEDTAYLDDSFELIYQTTNFSDYRYNIQTDGENYRRLLYAEKTAKYLNMYMRYSQKLDNLPAGTDPMEYALMESHEGYCMHFASLATLLLRKADVPARYVSGYTINPYLFVWNKETNTYKANVADYMAHAWVEIYLDNIGWVAVEMTPGGSLTTLPTTEQINQWESESNENRDMWNQVETPSESEDSQIEDSENNTQDSESEETQEDSQEQQNTQNGQQDRPDGLNSYVDVGEQNLRLLVIFCIFVGIGTVVFFVVKYGRNRYEAVLTQEMEKGMTRKAVKRINRRIYYLLCLSKPANWFKTKWTDAECRNALIAQFEDVTTEEWDRYMEIVKKNHYSHETISAEEMMHCYACYKKVHLICIRRKEKE